MRLLMRHFYVIGDHSSLFHHLPFFFFLFSLIFYTPHITDPNISSSNHHRRDLYFDNDIMSTDGFKGSPADAYLLELIKSGVITVETEKPAPTPKQIWIDHLEGNERFAPFHLQYPSSPYTRQLRYHQKRVKHGPGRLPKWGDKLKAKQYLKKFLQGMDSIPEEIDPKEFWTTYLKDNKNFAPFDEKYDSSNFPSRLDTLVKLVKVQRFSSDRDHRALTADRLIYPKKLTNHRGEPRWTMSKTFQCVVSIVDEIVELRAQDGDYVPPRPKALYNDMRRDHPETREENYSLTVFRNHIYQEIKTRKFHCYFNEKKFEFD